MGHVTAIAIPHAPWIEERAENLRAIRSVLDVIGVARSPVDRPVVRVFDEKEVWWKRSLRRWAWALESGADHFFQLEDDVILAPHFLPTLAAIQAAWPDDVLCFASTHPLGQVVSEYQGRRSYRSPSMRGWAWGCSRARLRQLFDYARAGHLEEYAGTKAHLAHDPSRKTVEHLPCEDTFLCTYFVHRNVVPRHPVPTPVDQLHMKSTIAGFDWHTQTQASVTWRGFKVEDMIAPEWWNTPATFLGCNPSELVSSIRSLCTWCAKEPQAFTSHATGAGMCRECAVGLSILLVQAGAKEYER
jgi:hypothetical protein